MTFMRRMQRIYKARDSSAASAGTPVAAQTSPDVSHLDGSSVSDLNMNGSNNVQLGHPRESAPPAPSTLGDTSTSTLRRRTSSVDGRSRRRFRLFRRRNRAKQASESKSPSTTGTPSESAAPSAAAMATSMPSIPYSYAGVQQQRERERQCAYEARVLHPEPPNSRIQRIDLQTNGRLVQVAEEVAEPVRVHDTFVSFIVPHGWIATRTEWGFYLSSKLCIGFVMAVGAKDAARELVNTEKLCVFSEVVALASPVFESKHTAVVNYAAHDIAGRGVALYDVGFFPGAVVFALCAPRGGENLQRVEERLASSAVVLKVPPRISSSSSGKGAQKSSPFYESAFRLLSAPNCVMQ